MHDFPPAVPEVDDVAESAPRRIPARDFSRPATRGPVRFLFWTLWQQAPLLALSSLVSMVEWLPGSLGPYVIGRVIDDGIRTGDMRVVVSWAAVMLGLVLAGVAGWVIGHTIVVRAWLVGGYATMKLVNRKVAQLGHLLPQRTPTGEVLSVSAADSNEFGGLTEAVSRALGALLAFGLIAALVISTSPRLGVVVLVLAPTIALLARPLLVPLQRREELERSRSADLTSLATDIVAGLRILRGIGGEQTFARNYVAQSQRTRAAAVSAGHWQGLVDSVSVLFSGVFLVTLTWLGAREVAAGRLSTGQLISFFGYAVFMVWPIQTFFECAQRWVRAVVAARRTIVVLAQQPPWPRNRGAAPLPFGAPLVDDTSGFTARPGELTVVVSADPDASAALADRLGRYLPADTDPPPLSMEPTVSGRAARRTRAEREAERRRLADEAAERAGRRWGVRLGDIDLADISLEQVRERILVSDRSSQLFAGTLQAAVDPHGRLSREQAERALHVAAADDVYAALPEGWQGQLDERGRGLSGGQRQRVVLARALAADPEVLVMVEPTAAVDAHTEADIAVRVAAHRRGRTTVCTTTSPLWLHEADRVALLEDGRVTATGTHTELLANPSYRRVVTRSMDGRDD